MGDLPSLTPRMKIGGICCGILVLTSIIIFAVCMSSYVHLGPYDQVVMKRASGKYVQNGPWAGQLHPFHSKEWRKASLLDPLQYAIVQHTLTSVKRIESGPKLLFPGPYDDVLSVLAKVVLQKHQYVRLTDKRTGEERVERGPGTIVPEVTESHNGIQEAIFINTGTAVVIRNKITGVQTLITPCNLPTGVWYPQPLEEVVDLRELIHVLPHEAMVVRDAQGLTTVYSGREDPKAEGQCITSGSEGSGGTGFFLPPYSKIVRMQWSTYPDPNAEAISTVSSSTSGSTSAAGRGAARRMEAGSGMQEGEDTTLLSRQVVKDKVYVFDDQTEKRRLESIYVDAVSTTTSTGPKRQIIAIDLRSQKSFYRYEVRTNDNVRLRLEGAIFWQIEDVRKMLATTSDPEGDVWAKSRSILIGAISYVTFGVFMESFNSIVLTAFEKEQGSAFWADRGLKVISIELNNYKPLDQATVDILQRIIRQSVQRVNDLQKQQSDNDVLKAKLEGEIALEASKTILIETQSLNTRLLAETSGATEGGRDAQAISAFIGNLNTTIDNVSDRVELFRQYKVLQSLETDTSHLSNGSASLYLVNKDMPISLRMDSSHTGTEL